MTLLRTCAATAVVAAGLALTPTPAHALSCVTAEEVMARADAVFTGRIVDSRDGQVLIEVDDVSRGESVEERGWYDVELVAWSEWQVDGRIPDGLRLEKPYTFAPRKGAVGPCSAWPVAEEQVRGGVTAPKEPVRHSPQVLAGAAGAGVALGGVISLLLVWRQRHGGRMPG